MHVILSQIGPLVIVQQLLASWGVTRKTRKSWFVTWFLWLVFIVTYSVSVPSVIRMGWGDLLRDIPEDKRDQLKVK